MDLKVRRPQALMVKSGLTQSGVDVTPVGGEMVPVDKISVFLSSSWLLILLILVLPVAFILYRKRDLTLKIFSPFIARFFEFRKHAF